VPPRAYAVAAGAASAIGRRRAAARVGIELRFAPAHSLVPAEVMKKSTLANQSA